ncbi:MAG: BTAD domain-containing putative transcriptional regulator [Thermodesulfobacteriota bacterium]|jgi:DNA-binding SARP family transcriptional activator
MGKVTRPIVTGVFPRKRLFGLLDGMRERPIIGVSGPAGCGKTTLVSSYLEARGLPCLWYQVDEGDADPATFFYYLGQSAKRASPHKRKPLPLLTAEYREDIPTFALRYFENLYSRLKPPSVVVFDDYQDIPDGSPFHELILNGLSHIPEGINVILISRREPPPALIRLRANHLMELIGWNELRLTSEESGGIVRFRAQQKLSKKVIRHLHETADGWAGGLVLMLESIKRGIEPRLLGKLTPEEILDYFGNELFDRRDKETQDFFLKTAFLPKMTAKMAEGLTGVPACGRILSTFSRENLFTVRSFHTEPRYQFHPLFRDFLLARARETFSQEALLALHHQAARLLEENGQAEAAVSLLREVGNWKGMVLLILKQAPLMVEQGRDRLLQEWLSTLPKDVMESNPWLLYWMGACRLPSDPSRSQPCFEKAFEGFKTQNDVTGIYLTLAGIVESIIFAAADFKLLDQWIPVLEETMHRFQDFPSDPIELRFKLALFYALYFRGAQHPETEAWAERVLALAEGSSSLNPKIDTLVRLTIYRCNIGDFGKAALAVDALQKLAHSKDVSPLNRIRGKFAELIFYQYTGLYEKCLNAVYDSLHLSRTSGIRIFDRHFFLQGVFSALFLGDYKTAARWLDEMASSLSRIKPWGICYYHALRTREALHRGDLGQASVHADLALKLGTQVGMPFTLGWCHYEKACLLHELRRHREAAKHLSQVLDIARNMGSKNLEFFALLAEALFAFDQGEEGLGLVSFRQALALGRERGYFRTWIQKPSAMAGLCAKALEAGIEVEYVQELIRRLNIVPDQKAWHLENWPWPVKIFTLGRFGLFHDEKPAGFSRKVQQKPLAMLKVIIALGGKEIKEEQLSDILWPEADGDDAHHSFKTTQHRLRQLIGHENAIQHKEGRLTLDERQCWVDVWALEWLLGQAEVEKKRGSAEKAVQCIEKAIDLYQGPFLADEIEQSWMISPRERLRSWFIRNLIWLGHYWQDQEEWEKAIDSFQRGLEIDDVAEDSYQQLMICYQHLGRRTEALAIYQRCRKTLSTILRIDPSPKTEAIYKSLNSDGKI